MDELLRSFIAESLDFLDEIEESFLLLEEQPDQEVVNKIFRAVHTIKGNSGLFDLKNITTLLHSFETILNKLKNGTLKQEKFMIDIFLSTVDILRIMISDIQQSGQYDIAPYLRQIESIPEGKDKAGPVHRPSRHSPAKQEKHTAAGADDTLSSAPGEPEAAGGEDKESEKVKSFSASIVELIEQAEDQIVALENQSSPENIEALKQNFSTLYDSAFSVKLSGMEQLASWMLTCIELISEKKLELNFELIDLLLLSSDKIRIIASSPGEKTVTRELERKFHKIDGFDSRLAKTRKRLPQAPVTAKKEIKEKVKPGTASPASAVKKTETIKSNPSTSQKKKNTAKAESKKQDDKDRQKEQKDKEKGFFGQQQLSRLKHTQECS